MRHLGLYEPPPPLEVLLEMLPRELRRAVRRELTKAVGVPAGANGLPAVGQVPDPPG
jgi:hypothetical protein